MSPLVTVTLAGVPEAPASARELSTSLSWNLFLVPHGCGVRQVLRTQVQVLDVLCVEPLSFLSWQMGT
jgi:hypothetical protein